MKTFLILTNIILFCILSLIHLYWASGGTWAIKYTVPDKYGGAQFTKITSPIVIIATLFVAVGLLIFALIIASNKYDIFPWFSKTWIIYLTRIVGVIFIMRAIGDFNMVGIFKKSSPSNFAVKDNQIYIPLCIYLSVSSVIISLL